MNIVLLEPEIPYNTGAIGRTCVVTGSVLHLIRPLGFFVDEKHLRRSGLDYWHELDVRYYDSFDHFMETAPLGGAALYMATTKACRCYADAHYDVNDYIMFGRESGGIPADILNSHRERCIRVPMMPDSRSINLSVSVGIVLYEALRQNGFPGLAPSFCR